MEQEYLGVLLLFVLAVGAIGGMMVATSTGAEEDFRGQDRAF